ncbi:hypothetical protein QNI16_06140 [Cytophagaceae bacterium YF14B1]|uniref:Uncharacterized protein n=1 Tax=Xanthocytophaga flava TaxID=3048013 RepID=A0AAE3QMI4_9BACT|nr:hypothetical protein [Xanthocytophaga flavus]MDJ1480058.1 hypothetical protein [Xanthocytophaga flavus]
MRISAKHILWLTAFSIAMGFLETAVVVYLRVIYYPEGFKFPLAPIHPNVALTEFLREAATMIMLWGIGWLTGKTPVQRFAFFLYSFAVWDIFYYVFLYLLLGWPESLFTWDVLFLIPVTWVGPVLAPCLVAMTMILFTGVVVWLSNNQFSIHIPRQTVRLWLAGCIIVIGSFIYDYLVFVQQHHGLSALWSPGKQAALFAEIAVYVPTYYPWWVFCIGEALFLWGIAKFYLFNTQAQISKLYPKYYPFNNKRVSSVSETFADEWEGL